MYVLVSPGGGGILSLHTLSVHKSTGGQGAGGLHHRRGQVLAVTGPTPPHRETAGVQHSCKCEKQQNCGSRVGVLYLVTDMMTATGRASFLY